VKFLGAQIDNNISTGCIHRCSSVCFALVAVTGLMTTDTLYFVLAFGALGQYFGQQEHLFFYKRIITVLAHLMKSLLWGINVSDS